MKISKEYTPLLIPLLVMCIVIGLTLTYKFIYHNFELKIPVPSPSIKSLPTNILTPTEIRIPSHTPSSKPTLIIPTTTASSKTQKPTPTTARITTQTPFPEIKECIMRISVDYVSNMKVDTISKVEPVFSAFIKNSIDTNKRIFNHDPTNYEFVHANVHGIYKGIKYWNVTSQWFDGQWKSEEVFDVSENGEVVRLLGCI